LLISLSVFEMSCMIEVVLDWSLDGNKFLQGLGHL